MPMQTLTKGCKQTETGNPIRPLWALGRLTPPGPTCKSRGCWHPQMSPGGHPKEVLHPPASLWGSPWEGLCGHAPPSQPSFRRPGGPRAPGLLRCGYSGRRVLVRTTHQGDLRGEQLRALDWLWKQTGLHQGVSLDKKQPEAAGQEGDAGEVPSYRLAGLRLHPALPAT